MEEPTLLAITVPQHAVDDVSGRAWLAGATGVAEEHIEDRDDVRLLVSCAPADQAAVALSLGGDATEVDSWTPVVRRVTVAFGDGRIELDVPANVFGDGAHPTTATCLGLVGELVRPNQHVLDLGCGAGLLSVAAARCGATVTAVDIWQPAVEATRVNIERAGVSGQVDLALRSIESGDRADVVLANIGAATLIELAPLIRAATGGPIVLSGLLDAQAAAVVAAFGGDPTHHSVEGWTTLVVT